MKLKPFSTASLAVSCFLVSQVFLVNQAGAQILIDFEDPPYSTGTANGQDNWTIAGSTDLSASEIQAATVFGGSQALKTVRNPLVAGNPELLRTDITGVDTDGTSVEWYAREDDLLGVGYYYFGTTGGFGDAAVNVGLGGGNGVFYRSGADELFTGSTFPGTSGDIVAEEWYRFNVVFDFTAKQYDLSVQSTSLVDGEAGFQDFTLTDLDFRNNTVTEINSIKIFTTSTAGVFTDDITFSGGGVGGTPGDFDDDGDVDGADFLEWQRSPAGKSLSDWEGNYGTSGPVTATVGAVPEPASAALLGLGVVVVTMARRRRRECP